jgi:hypothetical protein
MLDDLRRSNDDDGFEFDDDIGLEITDEPEVKSERERRFLGMTAVERMFIAMFLFMNVAIIGIALLIVTGRLVF